MRKLILTTAAVAAAIAGAFAAEPSFGTFTDTRDGQTYKTVKMPDGKTWMAQNLNYLPPKGTSWCYNDTLDYCEKYGRLYNLDAAIKACPAGYHLPSDKEWKNLVAAADGFKVAGMLLKAKYGWCNNGNGCDVYGFSALPGGQRISDFSGDTFLGVCNNSMWWTATEIDVDQAIGHGMFSFSGYMYTSIHTWKSGHSIRCVADSP